MSALSANGRSALWAPCGHCGFTDTETPSDRQYCGEIRLGLTVECDDCGAVLTFNDFDYATDTGPAYGWEATPPTPAATWAAFQRASEWRHREDDAVKNPERYSTDAPWNVVGMEARS